jgi:hypothetical protein
MAEENRKQENEDQSQKERDKGQPATTGSAAGAKPAQDKDDVQAYGEPSDGSGGTVKASSTPKMQSTESRSDKTAKEDHDEDDVQAYGEPSDGSGGTNSGT